MSPVQTVGVRAYQAGATDEFGDPTDAWAAAVDVAVYGWAPAGTLEPFEPGREAVTWDLDLLVPPGITLSVKDRVVVLGDEYTVEGRLESYDFGPFGFTPGGRVRLKRAEG